MPEHEQPHAKITMQMLYDKQLDNNRLLTEALTELKSLRDLPDRVRQTEIAIAKFQWIEKVAYTALAAGIVGLISQIIAVASK